MSLYTQSKQQDLWIVWIIAKSIFILWKYQSCSVCPVECLAPRQDSSHTSKTDALKDSCHFLSRPAWCHFLLYTPFCLGISSCHQALWVWSKRFLEWQENIWSENCKGQNELSDHKLFCFDMISAFLWLTNALSFGFLPSAILQTVNELVPVQLKTSEANKLLVISIIVLTFVDLELEGKSWTYVEGSRNKQLQEKMWCKSFSSCVPSLSGGCWQVDGVLDSQKLQGAAGSHGTLQSQSHHHLCTHFAYEKQTNNNVSRVILINHAYWKCIHA